MSNINKAKIVNPDKMPKNAQFTPELAMQRTIEKRPTNIAGQYGFRIRCLCDASGDARLALIGAKYADMHAIGIEGVRSERMMVAVSGGRGDGFPAARITALGWIADAKRAIGGYECWVIEQAAVECISALELSRRMRVTDKTATVALKKYLEALADWDERPHKTSPKKSD